MDIDNTVAFVTGGASGLGRATVEALGGCGDSAARIVTLRQKRLTETHVA